MGKDTLSLIIGMALFANLIILIASDMRRLRKLAKVAHLRGAQFGRRGDKLSLVRQTA